MYLTFTISSTIIPFPIFTKKMAWVSPIFPRADRPELLTYYISAIIYSLSKTYYGPEILVHFCTRFCAIFLAKKPGENPHSTLKKHRVRRSNFFHIFTRTFSKTSFSALNWRVAVKTRGQPFFWDNGFTISLFVDIALQKGVFSVQSRSGLPHSHRYLTGIPPFPSLHTVPTPDSEVD